MGGGASQPEPDDVPSLQRAFIGSVLSCLDDADYARLSCAFYSPPEMRSWYQRPEDYADHYWYTDGARGSRPRGPVSGQALVELLERGALSKKAKVWTPAEEPVTILECPGLVERLTIAGQVEEELRGACIEGDVELFRDCLDRGAAMNPLFPAVSRFPEARHRLHSMWEDESLLNIASARASITLRHGYCEIARLLLERGAVVEFRGEKGTPLWHVCTGHAELEETARLLMDYGADVDCVDVRGVTPLMRLCGDGAVSRLLLDRGANIDARDLEGHTALAWACHWGNSDGARFLISRGAAVNLARNDGQTPLHLASSYNRVDAARLLLQHGARIDATSARGESPLDVVCMFDNLRYNPELRRADDPYRTREDLRLQHLFDGYLTTHVVPIRIRHHVVGPRASHPGSARHGLAREPGLCRHVAAFLVGTKLGELDSTRRLSHSRLEYLSDSE